MRQGTNNEDPLSQALAMEDFVLNFFEKRWIGVVHIFLEELGL